MEDLLIRGALMIGGSGSPGRETRNREVAITGKVPFAACRAWTEALGALSGPGP